MLLYTPEPYFYRCTYLVFSLHQTNIVRDFDDDAVPWSLSTTHNIFNYTSISRRDNRKIWKKEKTDIYHIEKLFTVSAP